MQSADEDDLIAILQEVVALAFKLPIAVVDENEDTRSTVAQEREYGSGCLVNESMLL